MNRNLWSHIGFGKESWPGWPCSVCTTGTWTLRDIKVEETGASKRQVNPPPWDFAGRFRAVLRCNRGTCDEPAVMIGDVSVEVDVGDQGEQFYENWFAPTSVYPAPLLFLPPKKCPEAVQKELVRAFALFLPDPTAAGNALRATVEAILTDRGVPRTAISSKHRRQFLKLHDRIDAFSKTNPSVAEALMAVKWIGNEGSHEGALKRADVVDALEVIENVLDDLWGDKGKTLKRLIVSINKRRRPRSKVRRKRPAKTAKVTTKVTATP
jgi:hypothetical protein